MSATGRTPNYELGLYEFGNTLNYADYNSALIKIDSEMKANADASSANNEKITENTSLLNTLSDNMATIQGQVGGAITKNEEQDNRLTDAEEKVAELETKHNELKYTLGENSNDITDNVQKIQDLEQKNASLENSLNSTAERVNSLNTSMDSANASITQNTNLITTLSAKVATAETELETVSGDVTQIKGGLILKGEQASTPDVRWRTAFGKGQLEIGGLIAKNVYGYRVTASAASPANKIALGQTTVDEGEIGFGAHTYTQNGSSGVFEGIFMAPYMTTSIVYDNLNIQNLNAYAVYPLSAKE